MVQTFVFGTGIWGLLRVATMNDIEKLLYEAADLALRRALADKAGISGAAMDDALKRTHVRRRSLWGNGEFSDL
jgi:hypothetical protein